ncbi:MAG: J domain-containing protein [Desulfosarcinaceae bacterium]|nr:J domain-containing protein [Desulfosarcinaceae bacterium]
MYLARTLNRRPTRFILRQSIPEGERFVSRDLFDLGNDPSQFIVYPGGNAYYYAEELTDALDAQGIASPDEALDRELWDFLHPRVQRVISGFQRTRARRRESSDAGFDRLHTFDRQRAYYLRTGRRLPQGAQLPPVIVRHLFHRSRDEIEQRFLKDEGILRIRERSSYIYAIFDLEGFFRRAHSRLEPLDVPDLDLHFIDKICELNRDADFWYGMEMGDALHPYLQRYASMFFDGTIQLPSAARERVWEFINRHRRHRPPPSIRKKIELTEKLFGVSWKQLKKMNRSALKRLYRQRVLKLHPDHGGDKQHFIQLTASYRHLLHRLRRG